MPDLDPTALPEGTAIYYTSERGSKRELVSEMSDERLDQVIKELGRRVVIGKSAAEFLPFMVGEHNKRASMRVEYGVTDAPSVKQQVDDVLKQFGFNSNVRRIGPPSED